MSTELPFAFHDLSADSFPFTIEFFSSEGTLLDTIHVPGPGAIHIPGYGGKGAPITIRLRFPDGTMICSNGRNPNDFPTSSADGQSATT